MQVQTKASTQKAIPGETRGCDHGDIWESHRCSFPRQTQGGWTGEENGWRTARGRGGGSGSPGRLGSVSIGSARFSSKEGSALYMWGVICMFASEAN